MGLRVPKVDSIAADPMAGAAPAPVEMRKPQAGERAMRTLGLLDMLEATAGLPADRRATVQMPILADPAAWSADEWMDGNGEA